MSALICRKTMRECATPDMCAPFQGCGSYDCRAPVQAQGVASAGNATEQAQTRMDANYQPAQVQGVAMSEREQFEAAYRKRHSVPAHAPVDFPDVQHAWIWWQARAALAQAQQGTVTDYGTIEPQPAVAKPAQQDDSAIADVILHMIHATHDLNWRDAEDSDGEAFTSDEHERETLRRNVRAAIAALTGGATPTEDEGN